ncbi:phage tail protein [Bacillus cereus]
MLDLGIDNELATNYGLYVLKRPAIPTAKRKVEFIEVSGRHGALTKKGAYEDVPLSIKFNVLEYGNIKSLLRQAKFWLLNGKTLFFTDDDVYRKIKNVEIGNIENEIEEYGEFEANFTFDPFEYVITAPIEVMKSDVVLNIGTFESEPRFEIYGSGDIRLIINDITFLIKDVRDSVVVDSSLFTAYSGTSPIKTVGEFPTFKVGENTITWSGDVKRMVIEPRWRYL